MLTATYDDGAPQGTMVRPAQDRGVRSTIRVTGATGNVDGWPGRVIAAVSDPQRVAERLGPD